MGPIGPEVERHTVGTAARISTVVDSQIAPSGTQ